jgi:hypothetical protein
MFSDYTVGWMLAERARRPRLFFKISRSADAKGLVPTDGSSEPVLKALKAAIWFWRV